MPGGRLDAPCLLPSFLCFCPPLASPPFLCLPSLRRAVLFIPLPIILSASLWLWPFLSGHSVSALFSVSPSPRLSRCMPVSVWLCLCPSESLVLLSHSFPPLHLPTHIPILTLAASTLTWPSGVLARVTPRDGSRGQGEMVGRCREGLLGRGKSTHGGLGRPWEGGEAGRGWPQSSTLEMLGRGHTGAICVTLEFMGVVLVGPPRLVCQAWVMF